MPYTDAELLTQWQTARDRIVDAIAAGDPVVEYQIGSRRVRRSDPASLLDMVEAQIARYTGSTSTGGGRNLVQFKRYS